MKKIDDAKNMVYEMLRDGSKAVKLVEAVAKQAGVSRRSLERARRELGVLSHRSGFGSKGVWTLSLPTESPSQRAAMSQQPGPRAQTLPRPRTFPNLMPFHRRGLFNQGVPVRRFRRVED